MADDFYLLHGLLINVAGGHDHLVARLQDPDNANHNDEGRDDPANQPATSRIGFLIDNAHIDEVFWNLIALSQGVNRGGVEAGFRNQETGRAYFDNSGVGIVFWRVCE
jgi:hypothetical protein